MHFSNYISRRDAEKCIESKVSKITLTPTTLRQTPKATIDLLKNKGVKVKVLRARGRPRKLSSAQVKRILAIRQRELSYYKIARITGIPKSTAYDYCRRYQGTELVEYEIQRAEVREAKRLFRSIIKAGLDEEVTELARRGYVSSDFEEIAYILGEIENIVEVYR